MVISEESDQYPHSQDKDKAGILGKKGAAPTSPQEQSHCTDQGLQAHEGEALGGCELHSSYFPLKEVMCLTAGQDPG